MILEYSSSYISSGNNLEEAGNCYVNEKSLLEREMWKIREALRNVSSAIKSHSATKIILVIPYLHGHLALNFKTFFFGQSFYLSVEFVLSFM